MKKLFIIALTLCSIVSMAQEAPKQVLDAFNKKYPKATEVDWYKGEKDWDVSFTNASKEMNAVFITSGKWVLSQTTLEPSKIVKTIKDAVEKKYPEAIIDDAVLTEKPSESYYELSVWTAEDTNYAVKIDQSGKIISSIKISDDDGDYEEF